MQDLIDKAITASRSAEVEAREETLRDRLVSFLRKVKHNKPYITALELVNAMPDTSPRRIRDELKKLQAEGLLHMENPQSPEIWAPDTKVSLP
jgi:hypothetical protein